MPAIPWIQQLFVCSGTLRRRLAFRGLPARRGKSSPGKYHGSLTDCGNLRLVLQGAVQYIVQSQAGCVASRQFKRREGLMAIILRESDIEKLATMQMALDAVEQAFRLKGEGQAENAPRRRCRLEKGFLHVMSASLPTLGVAGLKSYTTLEGKAQIPRPSSQRCGWEAAGCHGSQQAWSDPHGRRQRGLRQVHGASRILPGSASSGRGGRRAPNWRASAPCFPLKPSPPSARRRRSWKHSARR